MADGNQIQSISAAKIQVILAIFTKVMYDLRMLIALCCCSRKWCFHSNSGCNYNSLQCNNNNYYCSHNNNSNNILCTEINSAYWWGHNTNLYVYNGTGKVRKTYPFFHGHHSIVLYYYYFNLRNDYVDYTYQSQSIHIMADYLSLFSDSSVIYPFFHHSVIIYNHTNHNP